MARCRSGSYLNTTLLLCIVLFYLMPIATASHRAKSKKRNQLHFFLEDSPRFTIYIKNSFLISLCCIVFILQVIGIQLNFVFAKIINYRQNCKLHIAILCINSTNAPSLPTNQLFCPIYERCGLPYKCRKMSRKR